jgi:hypothetical protein
MMPDDRGYDQHDDHEIGKLAEQNASGATAGLCPDFVAAMAFKCSPDGVTGEPLPGIDVQRGQHLTGGHGVPGGRTRRRVDHGAFRPCWR